MPDLSSLTAAMERIAQGVQQDLIDAQTAIAVTWSSDTDVKSQVWSGLAQISLQVDKLVGPWRQYVMNGSWTFEKWAGLAKEQHQAIQSFVPDIGNWSFSSLVSSTAGATFGRVKELGEKAATALEFGVPVVAIYALVVLVLLAVIRVGRAT